MNLRGDGTKGNKKYITLQQAAQIYGCTSRHMSLMARQGKLKATKIGRNWVTTQTWLNEYTANFKPVVSQENNNNNGKYISLKEAAKAYGCTSRHLNLMARQGKLKATKIGRNWVTTFKWLKEYSKEVSKLEKTPSIKFAPDLRKTIAASLILLLLISGL